MILVRYEYRERHETLATRFGIVEVLHVLAVLKSKKELYYRLRKDLHAFTDESDGEPCIIVRGGSREISEFDTVEIKLNTHSEYYKIFELMDLFCIDDH